VAARAVSLLWSEQTFNCMKRILLLSLITSLLAPSMAYGQYCMLNGQTPYSTLQPGITNFQLNTINRNSGNSESSSAVVVVTGLSTTVVAGQSYTVSISHSEDTQFFPGARNNLRIWIDYNSNFSYSDAGETVMSVDLEQPATTYTAVITIPAATPAGTLNMRVTAKMSSDAGHSLPTPCNVPADPLGYHGEMEDYKLVIGGGPQGQAPVSSFSVSAGVKCTPATYTTSNVSTGTPSPTYSWSASPSAGVTFSPASNAVNPSAKFTSAGVYTITCAATNSLGSNSSFKTVTVSACTTIDDQTDLTGLLLFPNPVENKLHVNFENKENCQRITVFQMDGVLLTDQHFTNGATVPDEIDTSALESGLYFIRIESGNVTITKPFIVTRN
jgi:hypothetical protein